MEQDKNVSYVRGEDPVGRMGRMTFFWIFMGCQVVGFSLASLFERSGGAMAFLVICIVLVLLVTSVKRLHDFDASAWFVLLYLLPVVNLVFLMTLFFRPGTDGPNRFGQPVREKQESSPNRNAPVAKEAQGSAVQIGENVARATPDDALEAHLRKLKQMFDQGLLTQEAYEAGQRSAVEKFTRA